MTHHPFTAVEFLAEYRSGKISAEDFLTQTLQTIAEQEPAVQAWEYLDPEAALKQSRILDSQSTNRLKTLQGIPIAVKDIFATADMPTGWGTPIHQGTMRGYDAAAVEKLRQAGAIILGKTVTTEYATARPGKTRNPHQPNHTPGGSSSGSAAAVASGMVTLAIGTQTMGSILRPAAYCGVIGFKPSFGSISRYGVMPVCRELDHVGIFARTVSDIQLLCSVLAAPDGRDPDCCGNPGLQHWLKSPAEPDRSNPIHSASDRPLRPLRPLRLALWKTPFWQLIELETQQHFLDCATQLTDSGVEIEAIETPSAFADCYEDTQTLMAVGLAVHHGQDYDRHFDQLSPKLRAWIERGRQTSGIDYGKARQKTVAYSTALAPIFSNYDAILMPVTTGPAPADLEDTGSPIFCTFATLCGLPALSIPAGRAANGLPLAVQLVGQRYNDRTLLQIANEIYPRLQ
ncbi:amidase [Leptolyngbya ohadii]|uniref:amidase n=1 Tax=Leptolyngbya ohadii TaxID=1962290 RepID=UPI000B598EB1|nr:amidase [Leptolyngbya ohadii]